jgi:hypothetical protein
MSGRSISLSRPRSLLVLLLMVLAACTRVPDRTAISPFSPLPSPIMPTKSSDAQTEVLIIENEGEVCFTGCPQCQELRAHFRPEGCFSSSCTRILEQFGEVTVDQSAFAIRFHTRFILDRRLPGQFGCTGDCGGGRSVEFDLGFLERGRYSVWLGDSKVGDLNVPPDTPTNRDVAGIRAICFGESGQ